MNTSASSLTIILILLFGATSSFGQTVSEEAWRHFDAGVAATKTADYEAAMKEFDLAAQIAPDWPDAIYNLGLAREGAGRYGEAAMSYRQYLRLAPNANDAADVEDLILRMFDMAKPALPIAEGFMGVPWGASRKQIIEIMNGQGYQQRSGASSDVLAFRAILEGAPFELVFITRANLFYEGAAVSLAPSNYPWETTKTVDRITDELDNEYGPRQDRKIWLEKLNQGLDVPHVQEIWNVVDGRTQNKYTIKVDFHGTYFADMEGLIYVVDITNTADSLYEKLLLLGR